jgi:CDP-glycerol glycerophosphotransferase (TagB/SpsB family)
VKKVINPDIVFFTNPHKLTKKEYYITNYRDRLTCYVPYSFQVSYLLQEQYNQIFHNLLWIAFYETAIHKNFALKYAINKGKNVIVTGYPNIDLFFDRSYLPKDRWKISDRHIKRIIWAPHHTIDKTLYLNYSNFLKVNDLFIEIAKHYKGKIQIVFKPHPLLKNKLYLLPEWGKEKTDEYYELWNSQDNTQIEEGDYIDLFLTSDALIHDSGSFLAEYFYTNKPELFIFAGDYVIQQFSSFGKNILENVYHSKNNEDIINFINDVILNENDFMKNQRLAVIQNYISSLNEKSASENIFEILDNKIS